MPYDNIISRSDAAALIPEEVAAPLLTGATEQSAALTLFRRVPMSRAQSRIPVIAALPTAYFVNGDTGLKQTTEVNWTNKYLNAEEIAAIVPIPESVLDDTDYDVWGSIRPLLEEAIGRAMDAAVFFGVNKPASWPTDIVAAAIAAGNVVARGTSTQAQGGIAEDINLLMGEVEEDGYDVNGFVTARTFRRRLRGARATDGQKILDVSTSTLEGQPIRYAMGGLWPVALGENEAEMIAGDFAQGIVAVRQDVTYKILDQAVIQDNTGAIIYNLAQQDMVAMRVVARFAWQVPNPINREQAVEANRYPFAVLRSPNIP
jgi:HK97 family phage major capsid protein